MIKVNERRAIRQDQKLKGPLSYTDDLKTLLEKIPEKISFLYYCSEYTKKNKDLL